VRLPTTAAVEAVAARVRAAGTPTEIVDGGFLIRDPSGNTLKFGI
jgi:hypothetical protein